MRKAEQTKQMIVARAAPLFNRQGYSGTSISDVMAATGLQKGGIYKHFAGKDDLAIHAFDYAVGTLRRRFARAVREASEDPLQQLRAILAVFEEMVSDPPVPGGCPIVNTAVESDDTHPALRERSRKAMDELRELIRHVVAVGVERRRFRPEVDGEALASVVVAALEGGLILSRLYDDPVHLRRVVDHLMRHITNDLVGDLQ